MTTALTSVTITIGAEKLKVLGSSSVVAELYRLMSLTTDEILRREIERTIRIIQKEGFTH